MAGRLVPLAGGTDGGRHKRVTRGEKEGSVGCGVTEERDAPLPVGEAITGHVTRSGPPLSPRLTTSGCVLLPVPLTAAATHNRAQLPFSQPRLSRAPPVFDWCQQCVPRDRYLLFQCTHRPAFFFSLSHQDYLQLLRITVSIFYPLYDFCLTKQRKDISRVIHI